MSRRNRQGGSRSALARLGAIVFLGLVAAFQGQAQEVSNDPIAASRGITATLPPDTLGPKVTATIIDNGFGANNVNVKFDESLTSATARNTNNYRLVPVSNTNISIQVNNVLYSSALGALLQISTTDANWNPGADYFLVINNVADPKGNNIAPYTRVAVSTQIITNLTQMADMWNYYSEAAFDPTYPEIYTNSSPSTSWFGTNYIGLNNGLWRTGSGIFCFDPLGRCQVCTGDIFQTPVLSQDAPTLFRRTFNLPGGFSTNSVFRFRYIVDDGMVLYLNGAEIYRYNMPAGALTKDSKATNAPNSVSCITNLTIAVSNLRTGTNVLAAAVYQNSLNPVSNTVFGLEMDWVFLRTPVMPVKEPPANQLRLSYSYNKSTRNLVMSWPTNFSGFSLVSKSAIGTNGSIPQWIQVRDQSNPYTNTAPAISDRFFEIKKL